MNQVKGVAVKLLFNKFNAIVCAFVVGGTTASLICKSDYPIVVRLTLAATVSYCIGWTMPSIFAVPKGLAPKTKKS